MTGMSDKMPATTTYVQQFQTSTSYMGTAVLDQLRESLLRIVRKIEICSRKPRLCMAQVDHTLMCKAFINLDHSVTDYIFANDARAIQLTEDDLAENVVLASQLMRNVGNTYNTDKLIWLLEEIKAATCMCGRSLIPWILDQKRKYRIENHHADTFMLTRKWIKKITSGFRLFCKRCGYEHRDVELIEQQLEDKDARKPIP